MFKISRSFNLFIRTSSIFITSAFLCRLVFFLFNTDYFVEASLLDFIYGFRFDAVTISYALLPIFLTLILPINHSDPRVLKIIRNYSSIILVLFTLLNCIDIIYYRFTLKRTTWDIFRYFSAGDDFTVLFPQFFKDYYYIAGVFFLITTISIYALRKFIVPLPKVELNAKFKFFYSAITILFVLVGMRGGLQLKPLNIIDASRYSTGQNASLVLNTPFTMMKSMVKSQLEIKRFYDAVKCESIYNPEFNLQSDSNMQKKNVVVIIMESLSKEYVGYFNDGIGFTPFLDSLMLKSTVFTNSFANGKRSIEALPAIFSALPNLMTEAHGTSTYAGNKLSSLAISLKKHGYSSSFYHGGANGTMGFDSYIKLAQFDAYSGLDEYSNEGDYDGTWGIYDLPYFQYFAKEQKMMKEPFLSSIFSLSAHHPYKLPEKYKELCPQGELDIHSMVCYSDYALKKYFETIKNEDWYKRSLFVITADHTAQNLSKIYGTSMGIYSIPIVLYDPSKNLHIEIKKVTQQTDISPSILDELGLSSKAIFFGKSGLDNEDGFAINYINNYYQYIDEKYCIHFDGQKAIAFYDYKNDPLLKNNLLSDNTLEMQSSLDKLKAVIQQYNNRMIENELSYND